MHLENTADDKAFGDHVEYHRSIRQRGHFARLSHIARRPCAAGMATAPLLTAPMVARHKIKNQLPCRGQLLGFCDVAACPPDASRLHWPRSPIPRPPTAVRPRLDS